jgi:WD40 repeat protein
LVAQEREAGARRKEADARRKAERAQKFEEKAKKEALKAKSQERQARLEEQKARKQAEADRDAKDRALTRAEGLRLSAEAEAARPTNPGLSLLLAIEGVRRTPALLTFNTLYAALGACRERRALDRQVRTADFSADGRHFLTEGWDGAARVWDAGTFQLISEMKGFHRPLQAARFSPDGKRVVTIYNGCEVMMHPGGKRCLYTDRMAHVWDARTGKEVVRLRKHQSRIVSAEFSPDGKHVLTASLDGTARIWDAATGKALAVLKKHHCSLLFAAYRPDGKQVLTVTSSGQQVGRYPDQFFKEAGTVDPDITPGARATGQTGASVAWGNFLGETAIAVVWDAATHKPTAVLEKDRPAPTQYGHVWHPTAAAFSPDGKQVVIGFTDAVAGLWDAARGGKERVLLKGHAGQVNRVAFSPDGKKVLTAGADHTARVWEADKGKELLTLKGHDGQILAARWSGDGKRVLTAGYDHTARVWGAVTGKELVVLRGHTGPVQSADFSRDGKHVLTAGDSAARWWDLDTPPEPGLTVPGYQYIIAEPGIFSYSRQPRPVSLAFSPDGKRLLLASPAGIVRIVEVGTGKELVSLGKGKELGEIRSALFSADGKRVVTASANCRVTKGGKLINGSAVHVWDSRTGAGLLALKGHETGALFARLSPDGKRLVTVSDGWVRIKSVGGFLSSDYKKGGSASAGVVRLWDASDGKLIATLEKPVGEVYQLSFSPDGRTLLVLFANQPSALLVDAGTGKGLRTLAGHQGALRGAAFSPDGKRLVTFSWDGTVRLWNARTGQPLGKPMRHPAAVEAVAFSPDGKRLATLSGKTATIWDSSTRKLLATLKGHGGLISSAAFSPDGKRLVTGAQDMNAVLWETSTGRMTALFKGQKGRIFEVAFSPDGRHVATASEDGTARIWPADFWSFVGKRKSRELTAWERQRYEVPEAASQGKTTKGAK